MAELKYSKVKLTLREIAEILFGHEIEKKTPDGHLITIATDFDIGKVGGG